MQLLLGLLVTSALVTLSYFFVDQPVMSVVSTYSLGRRFGLLKWLTRPPEVFVLLSPFVVLAGLLRRWFGPWTQPEKVALAAAVSTLLTALATLLLKMTFGRSTDGFHPFHIGPAFWAFPSGHTACTISVTAVVGVALPRWRLVGWSLVGIVGAALVALNHHFIGDIIGGAFVGWVIAGTSARWFGVKPALPDPQSPAEVPASLRL
jgi:membrane-associated phospholipid phosphatase